MIDAKKLRLLWDERLITQAMLNFGHTLDVGDWAKHATCFTDPVNIDFSRFTQTSEIRVAADLWAQFAQVILNTAPCHHMLGNFKITIDGDHAHVNVDMIASLWTTREHSLMANRQYGWYEAWLVRQGDAWKINRLKHDFRGVEGNGAAPEDHDLQFPQLAREVFSQENMDAAQVYLNKGGRA